MPMFAPLVTRPSPRNTPRARERIPRNPLGILDGRGQLEIPVRSMRASLKIAERIPESESAPRGFRFLPRRGYREARLRACARACVRTHVRTHARTLAQCIAARSAAVELPRLLRLSVNYTAKPTMGGLRANGCVQLLSYPV